MPIGAGVQLWGWDSAGLVWVKILVNAAGKLIIDPSEILEDTPTNGEVAKAPTSNWAYDHKADANAHHAKYTDAEAQAVANTQIATHAALPTVHQDAPALIATHGGNPDAHHARLHDHSNALDGTPLSPVAIPDIGARVYRDAVQSIPNAAFTPIGFNGERWDTDNIHDNVTNNARLTCKTAGKYLVAAHAEFAANATGVRLLAISLNEVTLEAVTDCPPDTNGDSILTVSTILNLAVDDYVVATVYQTSGDALNILSLANYSPEFMMQRIG